ncbi:MAG: AAA family ATPase, partial [Desulfobacterales bacterium]|nr:AAA family ATPase [Desulfobacterales bacterium]
NRFCDYLLTENPEKLAAWQKRIMDAVGENGQILIDVIPRLERVIGKQPPAERVGAMETVNRFNLLFQYFVRAIARPDHPLTLFIDDLQWADFASLNFLNLLLADSQSRHLLIIGAYRDNEVGPGHPLNMAMDDIGKTGVPVHRIHVKNLTRGNVMELVSESLAREPVYGRPLADLVHEKTHGNAFFVHRFLHGLYQDEELTFHPGSRSWQWNIDRIQAKEMTDNVVDFMAAKIGSFPPETRETLKLAACMGSRFELAALAMIGEQSDDETLEQILKGVEEGLLIPLDPRYKLLAMSDDMKKRAGGFRFVHDRVRQAAYTLIDEDRKKALHRRIGVLLKNHADPTQLENRIFDIAGHLNIGIECATSREERVEIARVNLAAGKKAKANAAYGPAYAYLKTGVALLPENTWENDYSLMLDLHLEALETAYLNGNFEEMNQLAAVVLDHARSVLDKVKVYEVRILSDHAMSTPYESVQTALTALELLGIHYPDQPDADDFSRWLEKTRADLADASVEEIIDLPAMTDPARLAAMQILIKVATSAYFAAPALFPLFALTQVQLSRRYGNAPSSSVGYAIYGAILCGIVGDIDAGSPFGELALKLVDKYGNKEYKAMTLVVVIHLVAHWKQHLRDGLPRLVEAYRAGLETGDLRYVTDAAHGYGFNALFAGKELTGLLREMIFYGNAMRQIKQESSIHFHLHRMYHQVVLNLLGQAENPVFLHGEIYDERKMLPFHKDRKDRTTLFVFYLNKLILSYLFGDYTRAAEYAAGAESYIDAPTGVYHVPLYYFYDSLARLRCMFIGGESDHGEHGMGEKGVAA